MHVHVCMYDDLCQKFFTLKGELIFQTMLCTVEFTSMTWFACVYIPMWLYSNHCPVCTCLHASLVNQTAPSTALDVLHHQHAKEWSRNSWMVFVCKWNAINVPHTDQGATAKWTVLPCFSQLWWSLTYPPHHVLYCALDLQLPRTGVHSINCTLNVLAANLLYKSHDNSCPIGSIQIPLEHTKTVQKFSDPSSARTGDAMHPVLQREWSGFETICMYNGFKDLRVPGVHMRMSCPKSVDSFMSSFICSQTKLRF